MSPTLSAELHRQGFIKDGEALWVYDERGFIIPNQPVLFDGNGTPRF